MKIWITAYCLTYGILERHADETDGDIVTIRETNGTSWRLFGEGKNWHRNKSDAIKRANDIKIKRLMSIDKQRKRISAIEF